MLIFIFIDVHLYISSHVSVMCLQVPKETRKVLQIPWSWSYVLASQHECWELISGSSLRTESIRNTQPIISAPTK